MVHGAGRIDAYVRRLVEELALLERRLPGRMRAATVHLGGGTPNVLSRDNLSTLFGALRHLFRLEGEIAAEIDPAALTESWVRAAAFHGLSRASLGVQDLTPEVQQAVNRPLAFEQLAEAVGWLRKARVRSLNFDLMYGLPRQSLAAALETVERALELRPERFAVFGYAHVPWMKAHQELIHEAQLPDAALRLDQSLAMAERLAAAGYVQIGLDHFALPGDPLAKAAHEGRLHRNFQGYTTDEASTLIGVGASAISRTPQGYAQNVTSEAQWMRCIADEVLPTARGVRLTADDRFRAAIIERLMCDLSVDLVGLCRAHGRDLAELSAERAELVAFERDRLVSEREGRLSVNDRGRPLLRAVCAVFDPYLRAEAARHSAVV